MITLVAVTRYDGARGYEVRSDGKKIGEVHRSKGRPGQWFYTVTAWGYYGHGHCSTRQQAANAVTKITEAMEA